MDHVACLSARGCGGMAGNDPRPPDHLGEGQPSVAGQVICHCSHKCISSSLQYTYIYIYTTCNGSSVSKHLITIFKNVLACTYCSVHGGHLL